MATWMVVVALMHLRTSGWSWHYIQTGTHQIFSTQALHLYADHPELQMGPATFLVSSPFVLLVPSPLGHVLAMMAICVVGLLCLREVRLLTGTAWAVRERTFFAAAILFVPAWIEIAVRWEHPDDALALFCVVLALRFALTTRYLSSAIALGVAADFKPWAVAFIPILLLSGRRYWLIGSVVWLGTVMVAWLPFLVFDHNTLRITSFAIANDPASALRALGFSNSSTPTWCRAAQLIGGALAAALLICRGRWAGIIAVVVAIRILMDPAAKNYYEGGLLLGTIAFDVILAASLIPWTSIVAFILVYAPSYVLTQLPSGRGFTTALGLVAVIALVFIVQIREVPTAKLTAKHRHMPKLGSNFDVWRFSGRR